MLSAWFILCLPGCRAACVQDMKGSPLASLVQPPPVFSSGTRVRRFPRLHRWPVAGAVASHPQCRFPSVAGTTATLLLLCTPSDDCRMANALGDRRSTRHSITGGFPPPGIRSGGNRHFESLNLSHSQWPQRPGVRQRPRRGRGHIGQAIWCSPGVPSPLTFSHTAQAAAVQERSWRRAHTRGSSPGGRGAEGGGEVQSSPGVVRGTARRLADRVAIAGGKHEERRGRRGGERVR